MRNGTDSTRSIEHALRRLLPAVFFHPIWTRLVEAGGILSREQVQSLLDSADGLLSDGKPDDACQALFAGAFQQLYAGDFDAASSSIQHILDLAEQHELLRVAAYAVWGAAAVCLQRGWYQQAAEHLEHLQSVLSQQHEWVLSNVIDVLRQTLLSRAEVTAVDQLLSFDATLSPAFEQLLRWGMPCATSETNYHDSSDGDDYHGASVRSLSDPSGFNWRLIWQTVKRIARGELRLKWVETNGSTPSPDVTERHMPTIDSVVRLPVPTPLQLLPQPNRPAAPDQLPVPEQQLEPEQRPISDQDQPAVLDRPDTVARPIAPPSITSHLLGTFSYSVNNAMVQSWPSGKGRAVFKYLLAHHNEPIPRDVLMDAFWPQAGPEAARNSLNVALHGLRQALKTVTDKPVVLFDEGAYCINPEFEAWVDVDEFDRHVQAGRRLEANGQITKAAAEYEDAIGLYQGDFLAGDPYEEWPVLPRERLRVAYLDIVDRLSQIHFDQGQYANCVTLCQLLLTRDPCREDVHCLLMRCYSCQGQRHLALRQYQICVESLRTELDVEPAPTTTQLYQKIRRRERV